MINTEVEAKTESIDEPLSDHMSGSSLHDSDGSSESQGPPILFESCWVMTSPDQFLEKFQDLVGKSFLALRQTADTKANQSREPNNHNHPIVSEFRKHMERAEAWDTKTCGRYLLCNSFNCNSCDEHPTCTDPLALALMFDTAKRCVTLVTCETDVGDFGITYMVSADVKGGFSSDSQAISDALLTQLTGHQYQHQLGTLSVILCQTGPARPEFDLGFEECTTNYHCQLTTEGQERLTQVIDELLETLTPRSPMLWNNQGEE